MKKQKTLKTKQHYLLLFFLSAFLIAFIAFAVWYYQPRHYKGNIVFELEDRYALDIPTDALPLSTLFGQAEDNAFPVPEKPDAKPENPTTLKIQFELTAQRSFFQPEEFCGRLFIDGNEYISAFSVENSEETPWTYPFPKSVSSVLEATAIYFPHNTGNWLKNLQAKIKGEQWVPFFVLKGQESTQNTVIVHNLQELFGTDTPSEDDLTIQIGQKIYTMKDSMPTGGLE